VSHALTFACCDASGNVISFSNSDITSETDDMAQLIVRKLDDGVKERLRARARRNKRSLEAEARSILEKAVMQTKRTSDPETEAGFGTRMHKIFSKVGLTKSEAAEFDRAIRELRQRSRPRDAGLR
jgi:plasmid stability protein